MQHYTHAAETHVHTSIQLKTWPSINNACVLCQGLPIGPQPISTAMHQKESCLPACQAMLLPQSRGSQAHGTKVLQEGSPQWGTASAAGAGWSPHYAGMPLSSLRPRTQISDLHSHGPEYRTAPVKRTAMPKALDSSDTGSRPPPQCVLAAFLSLP